MAKSNSRKSMETRKGSRTRTVELAVAMYDSLIYSGYFVNLIEYQEKITKIYE